MISSALQLGLIFGAFCFLAFQSERSGRVFNFSAGPASLPLPVLQKAQSEFLNYENHGAGIFELSHRDHGGPVQNMIADAAARLKRMLSVPDTHEVLYMHGGAHGQFAAVPLNLCGGQNKVGHYVTTGFWSNRAADEGAKQTEVKKIPGLRNGKLLPSSEWDIPRDACFVHLCASETIDGVEYLDDAAVALNSDVPLVGDFTSTLLSRPVDISKYGVIYASGGKNLGPSGFVAVIVRRSLLNRAMERTPSILNWNTHATSQPIPSIYNTPSVWNIYMHQLVLKHYEERVGGIEAIHRAVKRRASAVYGLVDESKFYINSIAKPYRSMMSIPLTIQVAGTRNKELEQRFVRESAAQGMTQLFGHPVAGGLRVTLYNGISDDAVESLLKFMRDFATTHRHRK